MQDNDTVKLLILSRRFDNSISFIVTRKEAESIKLICTGAPTFTAIPLLGFVEINGRINDADANKIQATLLREDIGGIEIIECNQAF